jgi:hypothetical protein
MTRLSRLLSNLILCVSTLLTLVVDAVWFFRLCLRSPTTLAAENLFLRKQLAQYQERNVQPRRATNATRLAMVWLARWFDWRQALAVVQPQTFLRWHSQGFRLFWRWKAQTGRRPIPAETCKRSSAVWHWRTPRGARSALPMSCCSSLACACRLAPYANICRSACTVVQVSV